MYRDFTYVDDIVGISKLLNKAPKNLNIIITNLTL